MSEQNHDEVRGAVRDAYGKVAQGATLGGCKPACCATASESLKLGYSGEELAAVPEGADMGLGCGNPQAIAALQPGEFDCFLAARQVGPTGRVIGVDMTPEMVNKARANARKIAAHNVDFRLGEIEHLPVADGQVDVILSNCVINLSPDKRAVAPFVAMLPSPYREALTLTELEGLTQKDAAAMLGVSLSGMKSRVQRGRTRLREMFNDCCEITVDPRGRVIGYEKRPDWKPPGSCCS